LEEALKQKSKMNGHKTRATSTQNGTINITLNGCCLVTLSWFPRYSYILQEEGNLVQKVSTA